MNRYSLWKYLVLILIVGAGFIYALPNLYAPDPALQVTGYSAAFTVDEKTLNTARKALDEAGIDYFGEEIDGNVILIRLKNSNDQLPAQKVVKTALNSRAGAKADEYVVALNSASTTPEWLRDLGAKPMSLGLDLAGGVHFLLEVDTPAVVTSRMEDMQEAAKKAIRERRLFNVDVSREGATLILTADSEEKQAQLADLLREELPDLARQRGVSGNRYWVRGQMSEEAIRSIEDHAVSQNLTTLRNRVNELGVSEPLVQRQGRSRIVVELPGVQDTARAKSIIGKTANLEFRLEAGPDALATQREHFEFRDQAEQQRFGGAYLERRKLITGERVTNAVSSFDSETSQPQVNISLDSEGGAAMHRATRSNVGRRMGVLFIEYFPRTERVIENGVPVEKIVQVPQKSIISLATIQSPLGKEFRITGLSNPAEASELALLLRAGSLAAPMVFVEERTIGPSLGAENIALGVKSVKLGLLLVVVFMVVFYRVFGIAANIALAINIVLLTAIMSLFGATLTLPGIAGIVLTVGMAVDANVLIFSRIREELANGVPPQSAINSGFERAFTTILDANLTTLIVALILFGIGSGPVKGFSVTLSIGILTSMFTAIVGTRAVINLIYGGRKVSKLWI